MLVIWIVVAGCASLCLLAEAKSLHFSTTDDVGKGTTLSSIYVTDRDEKVEKAWSFVDLWRNPSSILFHIDDLFHLETLQSKKLFPFYNNFCGQVVRLMDPIANSNSLSPVGQKILTNVQSTISTIFWFQRIRLQRQQFLQRIGTNAAAKYHWANLDISLIDNTPLFNSTVIFTVPPFDFMPGCSTNPNDNDCSLATNFFSWSYLAWMQDIIDEIIFEAYDIASPVVILLSTGSIDDANDGISSNITNTGEDFNDKDTSSAKKRQEIFDAQCDYLTSYVSTLASQHTQFPQSAIFIDCVSVIVPSESDSKEEIRAPLNPLELDIRELAAQYAYNQYNTDYYFFPDIYQSKDKLQQHGWLRLLFQQFQQLSLYRDFGVVFFESNEMDPSDLMGPMLHREHFPVFSFSNVSEESGLPLQEGLFSYRKTKFENNLWLYHVYQAFASARILFPHNSNKESLPLTENKFQTLRHIFDVFQGREMLRQWLNENVYFLNPIAPEYTYFENTTKVTRYFWKTVGFSLPVTFIQAMSNPLRYTLWQSLGLTELAISTRLTSQLPPNVQIQALVDFSVKLANDQAMPTIYDVNSSPAKSSGGVVKTNGLVAVITAVFGAYEGTGKWHARQTIGTDFFIFTDREDLIAPGWQVVTTPYHLQAFDIEARNETLKQQRNSLHRHSHPFNLAKFYKMQFHRIDLLQQYETVIWVDGTVSITDRDMSLKILDVFASDKITASTSDAPPPLMLLFEHYRSGNVTEEGYMAELVPKYNTTEWLGFATVPQLDGIYNQLDTYVAHGFREDIWSTLTPQAHGREQYGLWCTCFVAWDMTRPNETGLFLDRWYAENRLHSTQDQVSFPYVSQSLQMYPHSLPDEKHQIYGGHDFNSLFIKWDHGM